MTTTLVLGGPRSGKSRHAEQLLSHHERVTFVATRRFPDDAADRDLADRITRHRAARPAGWQTIETPDLTRALMNSRQPVLVDSIGDWLVSLLDHTNLWDNPDEACKVLDARLDEVGIAMRALRHDVVIVTQEASWSLLPTDARERLLRDLLGHANQRLSAGADHVHVLMAGRVLDLSDAPVATPR